MQVQHQRQGKKYLINEFFFTGKQQINFIIELISFQNQFNYSCPNGFYENHKFYLPVKFNIFRDIHLTRTKNSLSQMVLSSNTIKNKKLFNFKSLIRLCFIVIQKFISFQFQQLYSFKFSTVKIMMQLQKKEISKQYFKISYETRKQLIRLVEEEKISIKQASLNLDINYSTGKLIIKKFRKEGKITRFSYEKQFIKKQCTNQAPSLKQNIDCKDPLRLEGENQLITQSQYQNLFVWYWVPNNYWNFSSGNILEQESNRNS